MNDWMNNITTLDSCKRKAFRHPAHRLISALRRQYRYYHEHPVQRDFSAEAEAVAAWSTVTCSYSGVEQAMKCLLQIQGTYIDKRSSEGGHRHHDIGLLFQELTSAEQDVIRVSYAIYRSLHDYISAETAEFFLEAIDKGYETWRYFLLEGGKGDGWPPMTHPGAMLEIWSALTDILRARVFTNHGLFSVKHRICNYLKNALEDINTGIDAGEIAGLNRWFQIHNNIIVNAYADLFFYYATGRLDLIDVPSSTLNVLSGLVDFLGEQQTDNDLSYFLLRAKSSRIMWNPRRSLFEEVLV